MKSQTSTKKVKAWSVIWKGYDTFITSCHIDPWEVKATFATRKQAVKFNKNYLSSYKIKHREQVTIVVPVEITYVLPTTNKRKK